MNDMVTCMMQGLSCALAAQLFVLPHALQGNPMVRMVIAVSLPADSQLETSNSA